MTEGSPVHSPLSARASLALALAAGPAVYAVSAGVLRALRPGEAAVVARSVVLGALAASGVAIAVLTALVYAGSRARPVADPLVERAALVALAASAASVLVQSAVAP